MRFETLRFYLVFFCFCMFHKCPAIPHCMLAEGSKYLQGKWHHFYYFRGSLTKM